MLKQVLLNLGYPKTMPELKELFKELCEGNDDPEVELWDLEKLCNGYRLDKRSRFRARHAFTDDEVAKYEKQFRKYDPQKDGFIDDKDLRKLLSDMFPGAEEDQATHDKVREVMQKIDDGEGDSKLDFDEYLALMRHLEDEIEVSKFNREKEAVDDTKFNRKEVSEFRAIFQAFDTDGGGTMDFDEFVVLISQLIDPKIVKGKAMQDKLREMMEEVQGIDEETEEVNDLDFPGFLHIMRMVQDNNIGGINDSKKDEEAEEDE